MADDYGVLRIEIGGMWTTSELFDEFEVLNEMAAFGEAEDDGEGGRLWLGLHARFPGRPMRFSPPWATEYELELEAEDRYREIVLRRFIVEVGYAPHLQVKAVEFASPGFVDLLGAGRIVEHMSKFILGITDRWIGREDRALAREHTRQKILKQKIQNAEGLLKLGSKVHLDNDAKRQLLRRALELDEYIESNFIDQKITAIGPSDPQGGPPRRGRSRG